MKIKFSDTKKQTTVAVASSDSIEHRNPETAPQKFGLNVEQRVPEFSQFLQQGNTFIPIGAASLHRNLSPGVYSMFWDYNRGCAALNRRTVRSDDLLKFKDNRYNAVANEIKDFWGLASNFEELGFTHKRGVLMYGDPGTGKSCIIKQVMCEATDNNVLVLFPSSESELARSLEQIKDVEGPRNMLVVLEDIDEKREGPILELFDGDRQMNNVLFLATTNYPDRLPARITRSGRFDTKIEIKNPPREGRIAYFKAKLDGLKAQANVDYDKLADLSENFSFAQLREFVVACYGFKQDLQEAAARIRRNYTATASSPTAKKQTALTVRGDNQPVRPTHRRIRK